jgi:hypothetical protein
MHVCMYVRVCVHTYVCCAAAEQSSLLSLENSKGQQKVWVMDPRSWTRIRWDMFMVLISVWAVFSIPFRCVCWSLGGEASRAGGRRSLAGPRVEARLARRSDVPMNDRS